MMRRGLAILLSLLFAMAAFAQMDTRIVDSLENIFPTQEGREKVLTMIELTWEFYDISFDDCIDWGERAIKEAHNQGFTDLEADATYALAMQYGYHADLDLAKDYLRKAYVLHEAVNNDDKSFEDLWNQAYFEQVWGNVDTAFLDYEKVLAAAERRNDNRAVAQVCSNIAIIQFHWQDFRNAELNFRKSSRFYQMIEDSVWMTRMNANLANLYLEWGKYAEAHKLFREVIPLMESFEDYGWLFRAYKNYGQFFMRDHIDFDSATYYFGKSMACTEHEALSRNSSNAVANEKADLLVEMGNLALYQQDEKAAVAYFEQAFNLAESNKYHLGLMQAALSLGQLYATQGKAKLSLHYLEVYAVEAQLSGITILNPLAKKPFILDYARLGRFDEMEKELDALDEHRAALMRENADIHDQLNILREESTELLMQYESQNENLETLKTQRNQYRLAFFGLLLFVISAVVLLLLYKIVRKNRTKTVKD